MKKKCPFFHLITRIPRTFSKNAIECFRFPIFKTQWRALAPLVGRKLAMITVKDVEILCPSLLHSRGTFLQNF